jgi:hypothetical protein
LHERSLRGDERDAGRSRGRARARCARVSESCPPDGISRTAARDVASVQLRAVGGHVSVGIRFGEGDSAAISGAPSALQSATSADRGGFVALFGLAVARPASRVAMSASRPAFAAAADGKTLGFFCPWVPSRPNVTSTMLPDAGGSRKEARTDRAHRRSRAKEARLVRRSEVRHRGARRNRRQARQARRRPRQVRLRAVRRAVGGGARREPRRGRRRASRARGAARRGRRRLVRSTADGREGGVRGQAPGTRHGGGLRPRGEGGAAEGAAAGEARSAARAPDPRPPARRLERGSARRRAMVHRRLPRREDGLRRPARAEEEARRATRTPARHRALARWRIGRRHRDQAGVADERADRLDPRRPARQAEANAEDRGRRGHSLRDLRVAGRPRRRRHAGRRSPRQGLAREHGKAHGRSRREAAERRSVLPARLRDARRRERRSLRRRTRPAAGRSARRSAPRG